MALSKARNTTMRDGVQFSWPVKGGVIIYAGGMAALNGNGHLVPAAATASLKVVGRMEETVDNRHGVDGDLHGDVRRGCFCFANSAGGDRITRADITATAYAVDDETVAKTHGSNARPAAGTIMDVDDLGVWVNF